MMPMYMNSWQPGQMRPQGGGCSCYQNYPHHVPMDASSFPSSSPCYGGCVHGNFPPYGPYWSPYYPPQAPYPTCCMNHPGFHPQAPPCYVHQPFPVGYQHGFESEKDVTGKNRCTKCSPPKNGTGVVIEEEHEPETEKGEAANHVRPYPIVWMPHENQRHGSHDQPPAPESKKMQKGDPKSWNGYFPLDENTIRSLMQNQGRGKMQNGFDISKLKSLLQGQEGQTQKSKEPGQLQYPIFWIPSQGNQEDVEASEKRKGGGDLKSVSSSDHLNNGQITQCNKGNVEGNVVSDAEEKRLVRNIPLEKGDPKSWNGSFPFDENTLKSNKLQNGKTVELPFDINKLRSLLQGQEGQTQKSKEPGQLQYPIFWIPSQGKQEDVEASEKKKRGNEGGDLKSVSSDHLSNGQIAQCNKGNVEGNVVSDAEEKRLVRNIPVETYKEPRSVPVKPLENHLPQPTEKIVKTVPAEDTRKEQCSSPPKASKLPPVCLRVEPLPKRKNGKSKSLSPPRRKEQTLTSEETQVASPMSSMVVETRNTPTSCTVNCEKADKEKKTSEECLKPTGTETESVETKCDLQGLKPCEARLNEEKPAKKTFTKEEAARIIQSRYRGYDVRRWEPIKKLKEIAIVREQMGDVKKRVQALELSADQHTKGKEIVVLGEMVMSLLLKLDSVQGLHPSIRDQRKSLARELSDMQENIDSLKKSNVEKGDAEEQIVTTSQTSDWSVRLEHSQLAEQDNMESDSKTEKVCLPSLEEHLTSPNNTVDGQPEAEGEEKVTELSETLATGPEPAAETSICEADSTTIPEKIEAVEAVSPVNPSSADGNEMTVTNKEDEDMVKKLEEPLLELQQEVETTLGSDNASDVSETVAKDSENEDRRRDGDYILPSEKTEVAETVLPINQSSADGNEMTMANIDDDTVMMEKLEEPVPELLQVMENATEVSETAANALENEDGKGEDDYVLPSEMNEAVDTVRPVNSSPADAVEMTVTNIDEDQVMEETLTHGQDFEGLENATEVSGTVVSASETEDVMGDEVELSELPVGVVEDEMQLLSQDSLSSPGEEKTLVSPETASKEETNVHHTCDHSSDIGEETTQVTEREMSEDTKKLMEENQRFKETMETLLKAGREQLEVISKLTGRVKSLEKKLSQKKRTHIGRRKPYRGKQTTKPRPANCTDAVL